MKFSTALLSLAASLSVTTAQTLPCNEAERYGIITVSPTNVSSGDSIAISLDLNCAINYFDIVPQCLDYAIEVPYTSNNGHEPNIVLARRTFDSTTGATFDNFTTQIPYYGSYFPGAAYQVTFTNTYPLTASDGSQVLIQGGSDASINITPTVA